MLTLPTPLLSKRSIRQHRRSLHGTNPSTLSLNNLEQHLKLASKVTFPDWLLLKVLTIKEYQNPTPTNLFGEEIGALLEKECRLHLQSEPWWPALESKSKHSAAWDLMSPWKKLQLDIQQRADIRLNEPSTNDLDDAFDEIDIDPTKVYIEPAESSSGELRIRNDSRVPSRRSPDETMVNAALVSLLQGITDSHPDVDGKFDWTIIHRKFEVSQLRHNGNKEERKKIMTAKVDGFLHVTEPDKLEEHCDALCILETKPARRSAQPIAVAMQEAGKMAAWISTEHELGLLPSFQSDAPGKVKRRFLISQYLDEICITVAEYDDEYIRYIANKSHSESSARTRHDNQRGQKRQRGQWEMRETRGQGEEDEESDQEREKQQKLEEDEVESLNDERDP
ncbi:unnamed protein product [Clonostachys rhizophaga]|uniref:Uncharacterized protein n=1 Tax=Clonostachys rhizophaga TaxID=160324 RepID=A0A9N9YJ35_9HYPO|nr:unnamed protein product [Clonostachys rhizophaga]